MHPMPARGGDRAPQGRGTPREGDPRGGDTGNPGRPRTPSPILPRALTSDRLLHLHTASRPGWPRPSLATLVAPPPLSAMAPGADPRPRPTLAPPTPRIAPPLTYKYRRSAPPPSRPRPRSAMAARARAPLAPRTPRTPLAPLPLALAVLALLALPVTAGSPPGPEEQLVAAAPRWGWQNVSCPACRVLFGALDLALQVGTGDRGPPGHRGHRVAPGGRRNTGRGTGMDTRTGRAGATGLGRERGHGGQDGDRGDRDRTGQAGPVPRDGPGQVGTCDRHETGLGMGTGTGRDGRGRGE